MISLILLFSFLSLADGGSPCTDDINKLCAKVSPGAGAVVDCMKDKSEKNLLSAECKKYLELILQENRKPSQTNSKKKKSNEKDCLKQNLCKKMPKGAKVQCTEQNIKAPKSCSLDD